ncbi:MAG: hypothetical protein QXD04_05305 [Candidatus Bathyarchaeia archaeon]
MHVSLKHLIGTVTLMSLIMSAGYSYTLITSYMEAQILRGQLQQIAEYVALNLVEVINLVKYTNRSEPQPTYKLLKIPKDLGGRAYIIELKNETAGGKGYYIRARLLIREDVEAFSIIPINTTELSIELKAEGNGTITSRNGNINWTSVIHGGYEPGVYETVVWGMMNATQIDETWIVTLTAGLGRLDRGGS